MDYKGIPAGAVVFIPSGKQRIRALDDAVIDAIEPVIVERVPK